MSEGNRGLSLAVLGAGYVGLITSACLAQLGRRVVCIDRDGPRIRGLERGVMPFHEPGLEESVHSGAGSGRLTFSTRLEAAHGAVAILVAVGTLDEQGDWTARFVEAALAEILADPAAPRTIVIRSTLMPGTTARLSEMARAIDPEFEICFNPEFTRQGCAIADFLGPDRVVIGTTRTAAESRAVDILIDAYAGVRAPMIVTDAASAELIKVGANVFLGMKVGFANELARLSAAAGADISAVVDGIGLDPRIDRRYLSPGPGFGGSCLPSQARALPEFARSLEVDTPIIDAIAGSNSAQAQWVVDRVERETGDLHGRLVGMLGLTFKAGTDDTRESPAVAIAELLVRRGAHVVAHDPKAVGVPFGKGMPLAAAVSRVDDPADVACDADAIVIATDWPEYRGLDWHAMARVMRGRVVVDARAAADAVAAGDAGLRLFIHGREAGHNA